MSEIENDDLESCLSSTDSLDHESHSDVDLSPQRASRCACLQSSRNKRILAAVVAVAIVLLLVVVLVAVPCTCMLEGACVVSFCRHCGGFEEYSDTGGRLTNARCDKGAILAYHPTFTGGSRCPNSVVRPTFAQCQTRCSRVKERYGVTGTCSWQAGEVERAGFSFIPCVQNKLKVPEIKNQVAINRDGQEC